MSNAQSSFIDKDDLLKIQNSVNRIRVSTKACLDIIEGVLIDIADRTYSDVEEESNST